MRFLIIAVLLSCGLYGQEKKFTLTAHLKGFADHTPVFLTHKYNEEFIVDSSSVKGGKAVFSGTTPEPNMYWITTQRNVNPSLIFFIDGGKVEITGHADSLGKAIIKAGKTQEDYKTFQAITAKTNDIKAGMLKRFQMCNGRGDQDGAKKIQDSAFQNERAYVKNLTNFIKKNPSSNIGGFIIFSSAFDWPSIPEYDSMYNALGDNVKKGKFGKLALDKINSMKGTTVGYTALDFSQADVNGKNISLSSYKGKFVLVDFWASWCGPCRKENPNVVAAYKKYNSKGFDVFGVSLDDNKEKWLKAIEKDGLTWQHVSDLKGWQNAAAKSYGVSSIPFNLLLDKDGKILAKNLRGEELDAALVQIFGE